MGARKNTAIDDEVLAISLGAGGWSVILGVGAAFNAVASPGVALAAGLSGGLTLAVPVSIGTYKATKWAVNRNARSGESNPAQSPSPADQEHPQPKGP